MANSSTSSTSSGNTNFTSFLNGGEGLGLSQAKSLQKLDTKSFALNLAVSLGLFAFEISGFFLLKSSAVGRRIYQPKTYLVQDRLRVEAVPANPIKWIRRIFNIKDEELKIKCGLDGYFFIRLMRAMIIIFVPLMVILVTVLIPIDYIGGAGEGTFDLGDRRETFTVTGFNELSWQNVAPTHTNRYWASLVCAVLAISWTLYRIYREKLNFIDVRQRFLTSPEHRLKASAKTVLITNIPREYRSKEALEALYDVFVDNDDRSRLTVWVNRDYGSLRALVARRRSLRHALEKEELRILRLVNKKYRKSGEVKALKRTAENNSRESLAPDNDNESNAECNEQGISTAYERDCHEEGQLWQKYLEPSTASQISLVRGKNGSWKPASLFKMWVSGERKKVPKIAWLRAEIARLTVRIEELLLKLDDEERFKKQNSAFIQFDRQMSAHMACSLVSHNKAGRMSPRFLEVAPHEIIWPNMDVTSRGRFVRTCIALVLFLGMLFLWGIPTAILGITAQLGELRSSISWLSWLEPWPSWVISLISGPLTSILLALLVQLVVPALSRKLAVLVGTPTRSKREIVTQNFYFIFLLIELVLLTGIASGAVTVVPLIAKNPVSIPNILATNLPKSANHFINYLVIQALGFSGSVLFQYLRILYITTIWPWFTQTPRQEAWLQTTIPHQMWANVYSLSTNFAVIGLIYCVISPLMLVFVSLTFCLFWVAYRHNYYYVQRNKIDTHGLLFNNAFSQLFAGIYVLEVALIGLFFLVRDTQNKVVCSPQAIIMIVVTVLTAAFHFTMEQHLRPLYEFLPVALEDSAVEAETQRFLTHNDNEPSHSERGDSGDIELSEMNSVVMLDGSNAPTEKRASGFQLTSVPATAAHARNALSRSKKEDAPTEKRASGFQLTGVSATASHARNALSRLKKETTARITEIHTHVPEPIHRSRRQDIAEQLAATIAGYPDELTDLSPDEREAELKAAFQDPVTREPAPIIWIPQDPAGISEDAIKQASKYGRYLQYSNAGAYLTTKNKCEITQPAPDVRPDWLLDWVL